MTVHRPNDRPSAPQETNVYSHFLASLGAQEKTDGTSMLRSIDSYQNRVSADQYHLTVSRTQVSTHWRGVSFEVIRWQVTSFQMIAGSSIFLFKLHMKYVVFMSLRPRTIKILISNWPRTRKFSHFDSWSWQSFVSTCDVLNCLFPLDVQNEIRLLSRVFRYSWLVCLLGFWLSNVSLVKVGEIRFRMASFSFFNLLDVW